MDGLKHKDVFCITNLFVIFNRKKTERSDRRCTMKKSTENFSEWRKYRYVSKVIFTSKQDPSRKIS